jgi:hypothetical protein
VAIESLFSIDMMNTTRIRGGRCCLPWSVRSAGHFTLHFPRNRLAQFNLSYFGNPTNSFIAVGPKGSIQFNPAYTFGSPLKQTMTIGEEKKEEGFADVRVLEGILKALESGKSTALELVIFETFRRERRIDTETQRMSQAPYRLRSWCMRAIPDGALKRKRRIDWSFCHK